MRAEAAGVSDCAALALFLAPCCGRVGLLHGHRAPGSAVLWREGPHGDGPAARGRRPGGSSKEGVACTALSGHAFAVPVQMAGQVQSTRSQGPGQPDGGDQHDSSRCSGELSAHHESICRTPRTAV